MKVSAQTSDTSKYTILPINPAGVTLARPPSIFLAPLAEPLVSANRFATGRKIDSGSRRSVTFFMSPALPCGRGQAILT